MKLYSKHDMFITHLLSGHFAVAAAAQKRSREQTDTQKDLSHDQLPLAKREAVEADRLILPWIGQ